MTPIPERLKPHLLASAILAAFAFLTFWPTLRVGFMIDDPFLIQGVEAYPGWNAASLKADFTKSIHKPQTSPLFRPLLALMVRGEYSLWGRRPLGYHAVSLFFHVLNAILLYFLIQALGFPPWTALLTAAMFAVHPLIIDDLFAATGGESMANAFLFGSLLAYLRQKHWWGFILALAAFLAKESNIMLPFYLGLFLYYRKARPDEYRPAIALLVAAGLYLWLRSHSDIVVPGITPGLVILFMIKVLPKVVFRYLKMIVFPVGLESWPPLGHLSHFWPLYLFLFAALLAAAWFWRPGRLCAAWFLLALLPRVPAMIIGGVVMDKWISAGAPAVFLAAAILLAEAVRSPSLKKRVPAAALVGGLMAFWVVQAGANCRLRGSDEWNYLYTLRKGPREFADYRLGVILLQRGRSEEALPYFQTAMSLNPNVPEYKEAAALAQRTSKQSPAKR